jgi:hypothetical protein
MVAARNPQGPPSALADLAARVRAQRAVRHGSVDEEWVCAVCGHRAAEQRIHRLAGVHRCPSQKWRREPVRRREVRLDELVDRSLSPEHAEALARVNADESRRLAADALDSMRRAYTAVRRNWCDAIQHEAMARLVPEHANHHRAEEDRARALAVSAVEQVRESLREVERRVRDAGLVDEAKAILAWNSAPSAQRREAKARVRGRVVPELGTAVDAELLERSRELAVKAEALPTDGMRCEAAVVVRDLTGFGEQAGRWERSAARANERSRRDAPLLVHAGVVPLATPEQRREGRRHAVVAGVENARAHEQEVEGKAGAYRALVASAVSPRKLAELEAHRAVLPETPEYSADFWHTEARRRALVPEDPVWAKVRELEQAHRSPEPAEQMALLVEGTGGPPESDE